MTSLHLSGEISMGTGHWAVDGVSGVVVRIADEIAGNLEGLQYGHPPIMITRIQHPRRPISTQC